MNLPGLDLHELRGPGKGTWAVKVSSNWRVTFNCAGKDVDHVDYEDCRAFIDPPEEFRMGGFAFLLGGIDELPPQITGIRYSGWPWNLSLEQMMLPRLATSSHNALPFFLADNLSEGEDLLQDEFNDNSWPGGRTIQR
ncbi:MAG: hypothetical protein HYS04_01545 [Acidobacteria bacterium]|nr:hypothetical protein [Acidobacteriota bacterium]